MASSLTKPYLLLAFQPLNRAALPTLLPLLFLSTSLLEEIPNVSL
jgi:hypothetical protein